MADAGAAAAAEDAASAIDELNASTNVAELEGEVAMRIKLMQSGDENALSTAYTKKLSDLEGAEADLFNTQMKIVLSKSGITNEEINRAINSFQQYSTKIKAVVDNVRAGKLTVSEAAEQILSDLKIPENAPSTDPPTGTPSPRTPSPEDSDSQLKRLQVIMRWQKAFAQTSLRAYKAAVPPSGEGAVNAWQASANRWAELLEKANGDPRDPEVMDARKDLIEQADNVKSEFKATDSALKKIQPPTKLAMFAAASSLSMLTLTAFFIIESLQDEGCWEYVDGVKSTKVAPATFNYYDNKQNFCSCGPGGWGENSLDKFKACPGQTNPPTSGNRPDPAPSTGTYPPCISSTYPVCDVKSDGSGIYYGYYHVTATGIMNTLLNKGKEIIKSVGSGFGWLVKIIVAVISILICLFLIVKGLIDKNWLYGGGALIVAGIGTGGYIYL